MTNAEQQFVALANQGVGFQAQGRLENAITCYRRALEIVPDHPIVLANLGNALRRNGHTDEAISCLKRAVETDPSDIWFRANLAVAERTAGKPYKDTLLKILAEPTGDPLIKMWAALALDQPEKAFAFKPDNLNVLDYGDLGSLYRRADLQGRIAALPALDGTFPHDNSRPLLYAGADGVYARIFGFDLIKSALEKCPDCDFHFHVMNPGAFDPENAFKDFPKERLTWTIEEMGPADKVLFAHRRWIRLSQIQRKIARTIIQIDADSIVNGNITHSLPEHFDVALYDRPDDVFAHQMVNAGFMAVRPSGYDFIDFLVAYILHFEDAGQRKWFDDQLNIVCAREWFKRNVRDMTIKSVPARMMDWTGTNPPDSLIWHAKGELKLTS